MKFQIEIDTDQERALPLEVTHQNGSFSFWGCLGCSRNYKTTHLAIALQAFLQEHNRTLTAIYQELG